MSLARMKLHQLAEHGELFERYGARIRVLGNRQLLKQDLLDAIDRAEEMTRDNGDAILNICCAYTAREEMTFAIRAAVEQYSEPLPVSVKRDQPFSASHITNRIRSRELSTASARFRAHSPSSGTASDADDFTVSSSSTLQPASPPDPISPGHDEEKGRASSEYSDPETIDITTLNSHMFTAGMPPLDLLIRTSGVERLSDFMLWQCHEATDVVFLKCMWPEMDIWHLLPVIWEWQWQRREGLKESERRKRARRNRLALAQ
jgi:ditrans,polycis-polyprenyl diphosphate synthase